ncbi:fatty acid desaturase [Fuerstiella marisgermanici]
MVNRRCFNQQISFMSFKLLPRLIAFPIIACIGQCWWMANYSPTNMAASMIWIPLLAYAWFCIGGLTHEIVHGNLNSTPLVVTVSAKIIGTVLGIPHTVYREVHMRHHAYLNTPLDWEMWPYSDPRASLRFRRIFVWFDIVFAVVATPIIWGRICFSKESPVPLPIRRTMKIEYCGIAVFWLGTIGTGIWMHQTGRFQFQPEHFIFALPPLLATAVNGLRKIMDHVGTSSFDPLHGTRTVVGPSFITRTLSFFNFDLAVHGPHHRYPKLECSSLKQRMEEISEANPGQRYPIFPSFFAAFVDTLVAMVRNPGVGVNAGCTDDLSHLPSQTSAKVSSETHWG